MSASSSSPRRTRKRRDAGRRSSDKSTAAGRKSGGTPPTAETIVAERRKREQQQQAEEQLATRLHWGIPALVLAAAIGAGLFQGPDLVVLVLAAGALLGTIAFFWSSIRAAFGETRLSGADAFAMGAPSVEEEQKRAVLRAIKDIEFERSVGKISENDYKVLIARYRAEAKRLLRKLDLRAQPERQKVEALVQARLAEEGLVLDSKADAAADHPEPKKAGVAEPDDEHDAQPVDPGTATERFDGNEAAEEEDDASDDDDGDTLHDIDDEDTDPDAHLGAQACSACGTDNDADAVFCKKCGQRVTEEED